MWPSNIWVTGMHLAFAQNGKRAIPIRDCHAPGPSPEERVAFLGAFPGCLLCSCFVSLHGTQMCREAADSEFRIPPQECSLHVGLAQEITGRVQSVRVGVVHASAIKKGGCAL